MYKSSFYSKNGSIFRIHLEIMTYIECTDPGRDSGHHGHTHSPYPRSVVAVLPWFNFSLNRVLPTPLCSSSPSHHPHSRITTHQLHRPTNPPNNPTPHPQPQTVQMEGWSKLQSSLGSINFAGAGTKITKGFNSSVQATRERLGQVAQDEITELPQGTFRPFFFVSFFVLRGFIAREKGM